MNSNGLEKAQKEDHVGIEGLVSSIYLAQPDQEE
jgi:hypothetical protein